METDEKQANREATQQKEQKMDQDEEDNDEEDNHNRKEVLMCYMF